MDLSSRSLLQYSIIPDSIPLWKQVKSGPCGLGQFTFPQTTSLTAGKALCRNPLANNLGDGSGERYNVGAERAWHVFARIPHRRPVLPPWETKSSSMNSGSGLVGSFGLRFQPARRFPHIFLVVPLNWTSCPFLCFSILFCRSKIQKGERQQ